MDEPIAAPAAEVQRHSALWQDRAPTQPVTGRGRLRRQDRQALRIEKLPEDLVDASEAPEAARRHALAPFGCACHIVRSGFRSRDARWPRGPCRVLPIEEASLTAAVPAG